MRVAKKILAVVLALACALSVTAVAAPTEVFAATKTITLIKGETITWKPSYNNVKSVSSAKKSIVTAKKNPDESTEVILTAKEKGSTTVTVKTDRGTAKYTVKVVGNAVTMKAVKQIGSYMVYKITNKTEVGFSSMYFDYKVKDADGDILKEGTEYARYVAPKSTTYISVYVGYGVKASTKKSTAKLALKDNRRGSYITYTYKNVSDKVKVTATVEEDGSKVKMKLKYKSNINEYTDVRAIVLIYDSDDTLVDIIETSKYLGKKETTTQDAISYAGDMYDHYEIIVTALTEKY